MKIKDYFIKAFRSLVTFFIMFAKSLFFAFKRFFTEYPHPTYITIIILLTISFVVKYAKACAEREDYNHKNVILREKLDSVIPKNTKYVRYD